MCWSHAPEPVVGEIMRESVSSEEERIVFGTVG